jgi:hypothetical protein
MTNIAQPIGRMLLKNVRLAFPNLFESTTVAGEGKPRYSAMLIVPNDHPQLAEIKQKMQAVAKEKWAAKAVEVYKALEKSDKLALHDGDTKAQYDGVAGNLFISAAAQESARPTVIDGNKPAAHAQGRQTVCRLLRQCVDRSLGAGQQLRQAHQRAAARRAVPARRRRLRRWPPGRQRRVRRGDRRRRRSRVRLMPDPA